MPPKLNLEAGLRHQEAKARLHTLRQQARELEARHAEYVRAVKQLPAQGLYQMADICFIKLDKGAAREMMQKEQARIWKDVEDVQREIVRLEREILVIEIEARLQAGLDGVSG